MIARIETDIVDVRMRKIVAASRDGNVELAREVSPLRIAILAGSWVFADKIVDGI